MGANGSSPRQPLSANAREELSDARLLLETAAHNAQAALRNPDADEVRCAVETAVTMTTQALAALVRVRALAD
jgi:hypothetical protein